jgi:von Willebrand factor type A domain
MVRRFPLPFWAFRFGEANSLLASAVCHLIVLVAMGLIVVANRTASPNVRLAVDVSDGTDLPSHDDALLQDAVKVDAVVDSAAAMGPVRLFDDAAITANDFGPVDPLADMATSGSGADGTALTDFGDSTGGTGKGGKAATNFFGVNGYGQTFVYVVDCSGSMSEGHKFERAVYELLQSIEQLKSDQRYFVIFYNHQSFPLDAPGLVGATAAQFAKTREWVTHARPQGGTVPQPALLAALAMKPDAIFFLSDGLFDPSTGRILRLRNRGKGTRIPIHTIAFVNRENERLMKTIANDSGGDYRYVP